jgi:hypothetical protein
MKNFLASKFGIIAVGAVIGTIASLLQFFGNPKNMGICVACFERDIAGALGLHRTDVVQYIRPEIIGFVLGSFIISFILKEFKPRAGSSTLIRFFLGVFAMIGALVFLGCPWRSMLRLSGGDWNAITGIAGLILGIGIGVTFLKNGFSLGRNKSINKVTGWIFPALMVGLFILLLFNVKFGPDAPIFSSVKGPGSQHANLWISLGAGLFIGGIAQRSRFCTMGAVRDIILIKDFHLAGGLLGLIAAAFGMNLLLGQFNPGFEAQPIAHSNHLWNFLGMVLAGLAYSLAGGCPGRQLVLAGEGDSDSGIFVIGMIAGAGIAHRFIFAAKPDVMKEGSLIVGGPGEFGMYAVGVGLIFCLILGFAMREKMKA